ncbi:uncharacterized protein BO96DRAFT_352961 [Aspergillus niger CBS 101883]|uniref:Contig An11c0050, genomic contig n=2 Tax=Aspergillus niger TaxID=5061 RepID=A2QVF0_ASPNC|nr:uncharacterized protein BO96DRAFT_352961 [Aspergillus niger CBS 101883]XP_059604250.1 uncharacterized protein An11g01170 [Aspergillus niger]PYH50263.1 hypothetical protein BO96DRAFT_352961 [Aspergillus niger CBS 101883]CAK45854.1 unnamed protein product [Aspergillus niger]
MPSDSSVAYAAIYRHLHASGWARDGGNDPSSIILVVGLIGRPMGVGRPPPPGTSRLHRGYTRLQILTIKWPEKGQTSPDKARGVASCPLLRIADSHSHSQLHFTFNFFHFFSRLAARNMADDAT